MTRSIEKGDTVTWAEGGSHVFGTVADAFAHRISTEEGGAPVIRNGSAEDPVLLIRREDGAEVLKLATEVQVT